MTHSCSFENTMLNTMSNPLKVALQVFGWKFTKILKNHPYTPKAFNFPL